MGTSAMLPDVRKTTAAGAPDWAPPADTVLGFDPAGGAQRDQSIAFVPGGSTNQIVVAQPGAYTKPVAAHEATHNFQNSRNGDFQRAAQSLLPGGAKSTADYNYGGEVGLRANPLKSIGSYNPEQGAQMVEDLTTAQGRLKPVMSQQQLAAWDRTKQTLERPIRQMLAVPGPDTSMAGRADEWIAQRPLGQYVDHPFTRLKGLLRTPAMPAGPQTPMEAPSTALGFANRSKLVR